MKQTTKIIKIFLKKIKNQSKIQYFSSRLKKHQNNSKETWKIMKEVIGKSKVFNDDFPKKLLINKKFSTRMKFQVVLIPSSQMLALI